MSKGSKQRPTDTKKYTMSVWVKRTKITGDYQAIYDSHISGGGGADACCWLVLFGRCCAR